MAVTLIKNRIWTPDRIARHPVKCQGGWAFTHPAKDLARYNRHARNQAIREWASYGAAALVSIVGGGMMGMPAPMAMALTRAGRSIWPAPTGGFTTTPGLGNEVLDTAGEYHGLVFQAPKTGNLRSFGLMVSVATGSPTADFQFETVDASTGLPTGTLFATNTSKTGVSITATWMEPGDFTADASVTKGQLLAAVCRYASGTTFTVRIEGSARSFLPYHVFNGAKTSTGLSTIAVKYSDGTYEYIPGTEPVSAMTGTAFGSGTNPNHRGAAWTATVPMRCMGGWIVTNNNGDYEFIIATNAWDGTADNDGSSNLTIAVDKDQIGSTAPVFLLSSGTLDFAASSVYRAVCKPGATTVTTYHGVVNAAAIMDQFELGQAFALTTANNPTGSGDWTGTATGMPLTGFWVDSVDNGVGGSGGNANIFSGSVIR
jgi:hypothetical protein